MLPKKCRDKKMIVFK